MTDALAVPPPPLPGPATRTARATYAGGRRSFRRLLLRGTLLELCTAGFYRFWLATDIRRHLWSHTTIEDDAPEYTGTGRELFVGFLIALAILVPINLAFLLVTIEAERVRAFASLPLVLFFYAFAQFAMFRARRYRASRTVWRGVRFWMTGSGWDYAWRAILWTFAASITVGLLLPWREAALERFKMRHTHYGDLRGSFVGTGWGLFKRGWWIWAIMLIVTAAATTAVTAAASTYFFAASQRTDTIPAIVFTVIVASAAMLVVPLLFPVYKAVVWRWWVSGIRIGTVQFESDLTKGGLYGIYWAVIAWIVVILILDALLIGLVTAGLMAWWGNWDLRALAERVPDVTAAGANIANYLLLAMAVGFVMRLHLMRGVWERVVNSTTVHGLEAADNVHARGAAASAVGEGFADSLDIGGL
jgi:uncharacterized membrane protein YjgN (DUF898 family)